MLLITDPQWCLDHPDRLPFTFAEAAERERRGDGGDIYVLPYKIIASVRIDRFDAGPASWWRNDDGTVAFTEPWWWLEDIRDARSALEMAVDLGPHTPEHLFTWIAVDRALAGAYERDDARPSAEREIDW